MLSCGETQKCRLFLQRTLQDDISCQQVRVKTTLVWYLIDLLLHEGELNKNIGACVAYIDTLLYLRLQKKILV